MKKIYLLILLILGVFLTGCEYLPQSEPVNKEATIEGPSYIALDLGSELPDWKTYFTVEDEEDGIIRLTDEMFEDDAVNFDVAGIYEVNMYVTDSGNKTILYTFNVEIIDNRIFTIDLIGDQSVIVEVNTDFVEPGANVTVSDESQITYDIDGTIDTSILGEQILTYSITNMDISVSRTVTVVDTTVPTISFNNLDTTYMSVSVFFTSPEFLIDDNYDEIEDITLHEEQHGDFSIEGTYTVDYWVEDTNGNVSDKITLTVNVLDVTLPHVVLEGDTEVTLEYGTEYIEQGAFIIKTDGTTEVLSSDISSTLDLGSHTLTYTYTDESNTYTITRALHVVDTTPPVITLNGESEITLEVSSDYAEENAIVTDNYDSSLVVVIDDSALDLNTIGTYEITYDITDTNNNIAEQVIRTIHVVDTTSPTITLNGDDEYILSIGDAYEDLGVEISDNYDFIDDLDLITNGTVDTNTAGTYIITYQTVDTTGNESVELTRTVTVVDYSTIFTLSLLPDGTYEITEYIGNDEDIYIPDSIGGIAITSIGQEAFVSSNLSSVELSSSITSIGDYAFHSNNLTSFILPEGLLHIGGVVFGNNPITQLDLPSTLETLGLEPFGHMYECTDIFVSEDNPYFTSVDGVLFSKDETSLITYPIGKTETKYEIPVGTINIVDNAFGANRNLYEVVLPTTLTTIQSEAFISAINLEYIVIPESVTLIEGRVFANAFNLNIFAEASTKPSGWAENWNSHDEGGEASVIWGYTTILSSDNPYTIESVSIDQIRVLLLDYISETNVLKFIIGSNASKLVLSGYGMYDEGESIISVSTEDMSIFMSSSYVIGGIILDDGTINIEDNTMIPGINSLTEDGAYLVEIDGIKIVYLRSYERSILDLIDDVFENDLNVHTGKIDVPYVILEKATFDDKTGNISIPQSITTIVSNQTSRFAYEDDGFEYTDIPFGAGESLTSVQVAKDDTYFYIKIKYYNYTANSTYFYVTGPNTNQPNDRFSESISLGEQILIVRISIDEWTNFEEGIGIACLIGYSNNNMFTGTAYIDLITLIDFR